MTYDLGSIMKEARATASRLAALYPSQTAASFMPRALRLAWETAKRDAAIRRVASEKAAARDQMASRSVECLSRELASLENTNFLGPEGRERLSEVRAALAKAKAANTIDAKRALIASAGGRFCTVTFTKADGSERVMRVQPAALKAHVRGEDASPAAQKAALTRAERHPHLMPVWDADNAAPRSVNLATISRIALDGAVHRF